jgi:hypothetical protein
MTDPAAVTDFGLEPRHRTLREEVRDFCEASIRPVVETYA